MGPGDFSVHVERVAEGVLVRVGGELVWDTRYRADVAFAELADRGDVVLDLCAVEFMDSSGLAALVRFARSVTACGHRLRVVGMSERVDQVTRLTGTYGFLCGE